jgi:DNA-binding MarR family transcriptional regulator
MPNPFEEITQLDKLIHEPARLAILTALASCESADFTSLRRLTGLSDGNLSIQVSKLEEAGLVTVHKQFVEKKPSTRISITPTGSQAIEQYWQQIQAIKKNADRWKDNQET